MLMIKKPFALQFPGQGSQKVGMGKALCEASIAAAEVFAQADELLGMPLSRLCFDGPTEALNDTINTQPAIFTVSVATVRALQERLDVAPAFVTGHSLGEFSALAAAGAISFEEALGLVRKRGQLMKEAGQHSPGGMAAIIGLSVAEVEAACAKAREDVGGYVGVANDNCPGQVVISGDEEALRAGMEAAEAAGARRVIRLAVSIAAHSPLMAKAAASFRQALEEVNIRSPEIPFVANATAEPVSDPNRLRKVLERQLTAPVRWTESIQWMIQQGVTCFVEMAPGKVLTGLLRRVDRRVAGLTIAQVLALGT
jgi:[acyl-carrier-protein] S-malonyltransferase